MIHINRYTQRTEAALAASWNVSSDGRQYTLHLRRGLRFSDGHPFDADDVLFSFEAYLDERNHAPQRDLLIVSGKPISVHKIDQYTVIFTLAQPYAAAERLFDSIAMLPRHLLMKRFDSGTLANAWGLNTQPEEIAGLGPFRIKDYAPGQNLRLERNPYYWKRDDRGNHLPYLDGITSIFIPSVDAEAMRFDAGETDIIGRLNAADYDALTRDQQNRSFRLYDLGPGLEYSFLAFNLNDLPSGLIKPQRWFQQLAFRRAVSAAIDRDSIVRLAYHGRAYPLSSQVSPGNHLWAESDVPVPARSLKEARELLRSAGFSWKEAGSLVDPTGNPVEFSIMHNASKPEQAQVAAIIQQDLKEVGINVTLMPLEFRSLVDRVFTSFQYEAAILALADGDSDPNSEMSFLTSKGSAHIWSLKQRNPPAPWQQEIDKLMEQQLTAT
ncbi:MAG TPA: ABC transporter substrate-binding protein, partial [Bryobacteraceae bacterium]